MTEKSEAIASELRTRLLDVHAREQSLGKQRALVVKAAEQRHDAIQAELDELRKTAGTDDKAAARMHLLMDERARCARVAAAA